MLKIDPNERPTVEDLIKLPKIKLRINERKMRDQYSKLKYKEAKLEKREKEISQRQRDLDQKEQELKQKEKCIRDLYEQKLQKLNNFKIASYSQNFLPKNSNFLLNSGGSNI